MATISDPPARSVTTATPGQVGSTPKRVLTKLGIRVLKVRGAKGVRR